MMQHPNMQHHKDKDHKDNKHKVQQQQQHHKDEKKDLMMDLKMMVIRDLQVEVGLVPSRRAKPKSWRRRRLMSLLKR